MATSVKIYTVSTCSHCKAAKQFLDSCGVPYECQEIDTATEEDQTLLLEEVKRFNPSCTVPTIIVGNRIIVGFKERILREALGI